MLSLFSALEQFDVVSLVRLPLIGGFTNVWLFLVLGAFVAFALGNTLQTPLSLAGTFFPRVIFSFLGQLFRENLIISKNIYFWGLATIFVYILLNNFLGLVPYGLTLTSFLFLTLFLSSVAFFSSLFVAVFKHRGHFFAAFLPAGTPSALKAALVVIELISYFARLFSLAIRLFANLMSGHSLLKILTGFFLVFLTSFSAYGLPAALTFVLLLAITGLETVIGFLQAYVFLILSTIYMNESVVGAH